MGPRGDGRAAFLHDAADGVSLDDRDEADRRPGGAGDVRSGEEETTMTYDKASPRDYTRLKELPISTRAVYALARADCWNEFDIVEKLTKQKLRDEPNCGPVVVREVEEALLQLGLALRDEESVSDKLVRLRKREADLVNQLTRIRQEISELTGHE